jgi:hypothetical protein
MLNILVNFEIFHCKIKIYLTSNVKLGMNIILTCLFHFYLLPTFIVLKFSKFCMQLIKTQWKHGSFHNKTFKKFELTFLCLC